jgi:histone deacetylase 11
MTQAHIVYSEKFDVSLSEEYDDQHPFDGRKYSKAWNKINQVLGEIDPSLVHTVDGPITDEELLVLHAPQYLASLTNLQVVAKALEFEELEHLPFELIDTAILQPMRYAAKATLQATELALEHGLAIALSGGYHHASADKGEGFCLFSDVPVAIKNAFNKGWLKAGAKVAIIDLDAHQGNGFERALDDDDRVAIFDMYNGRTYPGDSYARNRIDCDVPLSPNCGDNTYLALLTQKLPEFIEQHGPFDLVYYNAGTDIVAGDPLGGLQVSKSGVLERDRFVFDTMKQHKIPTVMVTSGGYTEDSHHLIADTVINLFQS